MKFSAASMQEYMMRFRFDPAAAADRVNVASMNARGQRDTHEPAEAEPADVVDYRAEITAICEQFAPEHLGQVDAMLQQYQGREEKLLGKILRKYCPPAVDVLDKASNATYLLKATQESMSSTDPKYLLGCIAAASESADPSSEDNADALTAKLIDPLSESSRDAEESQERLYDEGEHLFDVCKNGQAGDSLDKQAMMSFANTPEGAQLRRLVGAKWVLFNQVCVCVTLAVCVCHCASLCCVVRHYASLTVLCCSIRCSKSSTAKQVSPRRNLLRNIAELLSLAQHQAQRLLWCLKLNLCLLWWDLLRSGIPPKWASCWQHCGR